MSKPGREHGALRGADRVTRSLLFDGRFGRMFRDLPPARFGQTEQQNLEILKKLGSLMLSQVDVPETERNPEESKIPAGYTYLGQFMDHDISFDPVSSLQRANDPDGLVDYRTPRFDLDSLYGRGPDDQPYLYREDGMQMVLGQELEGSWDKSAHDLPRNIPFNSETLAAEQTFTKRPERRQVNINRNTLEPTQRRAIIGDPRNDIHVIIAQMHALFLRFHNRMVEEVKSENSSAGFPEAQQLVRWHYQWVIAHDFLRRIVCKEIYNQYLPFLKAQSPSDVLKGPGLLFYNPRYEAFIPVEFSAAAYRFGHSMVRRMYRLNRNEDPIPILGADPTQRNLAGFTSFAQAWAIDWDLFFDGIASTPQKRLTKDRVQPAYKIDTSLVAPLGDLTFKFTKDQPSLPERNLIRGWRLGLPSGEAVAHAMGVDPLPDPKLKSVDKNGGTKLTSIAKDPDLGGAFKDNTPLWFYILAEAQELYDGEQLGPVGGRIVIETLLGLLWNDKCSYLRQSPMWKPKQILNGGQFHMEDFVKEALQEPGAAPKVRKALRRK